MAIKKITNKMDMDLILVKLEDFNDNCKIPADKSLTVDIWTPWVNDQKQLEKKSIIIAGSNPTTSVGFCVYEHEGKLYVGADFETKKKLPGKNEASKDIELIICEHKIKGA